MEMARIGLYNDGQFIKRKNEAQLNVFQRYMGEILSYAGIPFTAIDSIESLSAQDYDILIVGATGSKQVEEQLWHYAAKGGALISYGGLPYLAANLSCSQGRSLPIGYAVLKDQVVCQAGDHALRFFDGKPWNVISESPYLTEQGCLLAHQPDGKAVGSLLQSFKVEQGTIDRWAVDIPSTIVRLQQGGNPVVEDGIPAQDGTAALDEGLLKADDECQLDWEWDRKHTETGMPYFAYPYADDWKEALIGHLLSTAVKLGKHLPFIDYWPKGVEQVAMISHDSDHNINEAAVSTLEVLAECGVQSTWCMIEPGFAPDIYPRILEAGHELAFHYNALPHDNGKWDKEEFNRQLAWLKAATGVHDIVSNKNHYTLFEGWDTLYQWCEDNGIASDQTRGPSKKGNVGFPFGTSHPYYPMAWANEQNRIYDVLQIGFLTQDLNHPSLSDTTVIAPFLEEVKRVRGVAHFLFHQTHIHQQPAVREAVVQVVKDAREQGFVFWTAKQINDWVRSRRKLALEGYDEQGAVIVRGEATPVLIWKPLLAGETAGNRQVSVRFGVPCVVQEVRAQRPVASGGME